MLYQASYAQSTLPPFTSNSCNNKCFQSFNLKIFVYFYNFIINSEL